MQPANRVANAAIDYYIHRYLDHYCDDHFYTYPIGSWQRLFSPATNAHPDSYAAACYRTGVDPYPKSGPYPDAPDSNGYPAANNHPHTYDFTDLV